jgi:S-adenosylmethionine synthetase
MFGYAVRETPELMPIPIALAHRLAQRLTQVRQDGSLPYLRPDGKTQVTIGYDGQRAVSVEAVVVSTQHAASVGSGRIHDDVLRAVIEPVLQGSGLEIRKPKIYINPSGRFEVGGPNADAGLTGRKIIVDTYGGASRHGGGAFSGKDPSKVDRSGAYAMRWVAKNAVAAGLADRLELQVAYAIGAAEPVGLYAETFGTGHVPEERIVAAIREVFDLRPGAIIDALDLRRPIYRQTAAFGHFGRELPDFTWERTDRAADLAAAAGL